MATNYQIVTSRAATILVGIGDTMDVVETWVRALPSEVVYPFRMPDWLFTTDRVASIADLSATAVGFIWRYTGVETMAHAQEVDQAGALADVMEVYVVSDDGALSERITFPLSLFVPPINLYGSRTGGGGRIHDPGAVAPPLGTPPTWEPRYPDIEGPIDAAVARLNAMAGL